MCKEIDIEAALANNDANQIKEFIKAGGNIYKKLDNDYLHETLMTRAFMHQKTEMVEILFEVYERDYKIAEKFVSNEKEKDFLLKYIFIASSKEDIEKVIDLSKKSLENSKKSLVFLADRQECVLASVVDDRKLMFKLYKNRFLSINSTTKVWYSPGEFIGVMNRLDLLKRMVAIGFNFTDKPYSEYHTTTFFELILSNSKCIGLVKYCLNELNLEHEDLLHWTATNHCIEIFEFLLEYLCNKNNSSNKTDFIQKYCEHNNDELFKQCTIYSNYELIAHIFTVYNVPIKNKTDFFIQFFMNPKSVDYIKKILEIEKDNFDDLLESIEMDVNSTVLDETWRALDKNTLKTINKNNVKIIIIVYKSHEHFQSQTRAHFNMIDPLAIYDEQQGNTALFMALERNCEPLVRHLISKGADLLHKNKEGHTTLTAACRYSSPEIIRLLLETDLSLINEVGSNGYYPLIELTQRDDSFVNVFKKMIKKGADINVLDSIQNTLLHNSVKSQNLEFVKVCLKAGVDPSIKGYHDNTALHLSAKETLLEIFELILDTGKTDIETKNHRGNTILHSVCKSYLPHFFFSFVEKTKPNVNALNNSGESPMYLCYDGKRLKKLFEMGADTSIVAENSFPFYIIPAHEYTFDFLEEVFSNPNIDLTLTSNEGHSLLQVLPDLKMPIDRYFENENFKEMFRKCTIADFNRATSSSNLSIIKFMFEYGEPQLEHKNGSGETAIFGNLGYYFNKDVLEFLIEKGADVNAQNDEGNSLIFKSLFAEGTEILLKAGASVQILNNKGQSALHCAAERHDVESCLLMLSYGADLNLKDKNNKKPSDLCTYNYLKDFLNYISE